MVRSTAKKLAGKTAAAARKVSSVARGSSGRSAGDAPAKKSATTPAKKAPAKKTAATKSPAKKSPAKKSPATTGTAKTTVKKSAPATASSTQAPAAPSAPAKSDVKKSAAKKSATAARKATTTKAAPTKTASKKAAPTKAASKKTASTKAAPAKAAPKKASPTKAAPKKTAPTKAAPTKAAPKKAAPKKASPRKAAPRKAAAVALAVKPGEQPWSKEEVAEVRAELTAEAHRLSEELDLAEHELNDLMRDAGEGAGNDQADVGSATFERDHEVSLANHSRDMLVQTRHALERIDDGSYGLCESCGQPIGKMRLQAFPRATLCMTCKQREERR